ncbi:hypothetical protein N7493_009896 [Penicillium malachiteum]|uniref:Septin-type G domain-containing protein n=1 Tax=Penicillium malachiteum TaxID=1324776 RepID=A0AAD6HDV2_9EURO|nr:hypothetical protein N7493_009896 [Penicillium malachiteum]
MRPVPDLASFSHKPSFDHSPSLDPRTAAPATFFLSRSPQLSDSEPDSLSDGPDDLKDTMYGVQSIDDTLCRSELGSSLHEHPDDQTRERSLENDESDELKSSRRRSTLKPVGSEIRAPSMRPSDTDAVSRPLTPYNPDDPSSLPSSPKSISNRSFRPFDDISITDEINSQVIGSDDEDKPGRSPYLGPQGASQLIMPSIKMPSRRPFTERGKAMGRFKILLGGASGSGKTSLIKSIVQTCEHIVHVDSLPPVNASLERRRASRPHSSAPTRGAAVTEIYASTKPYPSWWSDLEDSRVLRRRKSIGEVVLERNLCFVDTPVTSLSRAGQTDAILQYMRQQLQRATSALATPGIDFQNLLAGNGGSQVDVILYLISHDILAADVECIRKLCELTNVIPIVAKADTLSPEQIVTLKSQFQQQAQDAGVKTFSFGDLVTQGYDGLEIQSPYAVSSEKAIDMEIMDASTLMNPDYVQPLVPSELEILVHRLFDRDNLSWMRHSTAKKLMQRRDWFLPTSSTGAPLHNALSGTTLNWRTASGTSGPSTISSLGDTQPSYAMARITDYTRHEERMAQARLASWATDLQRSLQNERDRYAALARGDRAVWLTERLSECVVDGSLVPISKTPGFCGLHVPISESGADALRTMNAHGISSPNYHGASWNSQDPLGVVGWVDDLGKRGWAIVQIVGSVGVVGGLALWLARAWGLKARTLTDIQVEYRLGVWSGD